MTPSPEVLIVGGGIGGLAAALALHRAGVAVQVFEQAPALEEVGAGVSLWPNAMRALAGLGVDGPVLSDHEPIQRIVIRRADGSRLTRLDEPGRYPEPSICVHRAHLQGVLAGALPVGILHLGRRLVGFQVGSDRSAHVTATFEDGSAAVGALLIGCDGIRSTVRAGLHGDGAPRPRGYEIWRGVSDFALPPGLLGQSTEWWGPGRRFGILPGEPGRVFWYATRTMSRDAVRDPGSAVASSSSSLPPAGDFAGWASPVPELLAAPVAGDPVWTVAEDRPVPRGWGRGPVTLLGDAAHAMTPNMGQGACTALEDAVVLGSCLAVGGPTAAALRRYERLREARTRRIMRQSRRIGRLGQLSHPALVAVRDRLMRLVPSPALVPPQRRVYDYRPSQQGGAR